MNLRTAYKMVIKHQLEMLEDDGLWSFAEMQIDEITETLHDDYDFLEELKSVVEEHLETFGENYGL
jgi:hypothetical protein